MTTTSPELAPVSAAPLMTTEQAAEWLGLSAGSLRVARVKGINSPPFIKLGWAVRYRVEDLQQYVAARVRTSTGQAA